MNQNIIDAFKKLIQMIELESHNLTDKNKININNYRIASLKNSIKILSNFKQKITDITQLQNIKGIGKGTIERVKEILETGKLSELTNYEKLAKKTLEREAIIEDLMRVIGIGRIMAINLIDTHKIKTVSELKKLSDEGKIILNDKIKLGLDYLGKFEGSIQRTEMDKIYDHLQNITDKYNKNMFITICGSYRRGLSKMSDIDIMLCDLDLISIDEIMNSDVLINYVTYLHDQGFLIDDITDKNFKTKYMGFGRLNNKTPIRRVDIRLIPIESYFSALIYFTGSYYFNQEMRLQAKKLGYKLNEYGLFDNRTYDMLPIFSEQELFDILNMKYIPPNER